MNQKSKNILAGLVLGLSFLIFTSGSQQAQGGPFHNYFYSSSGQPKRNHPFYVQDTLPQWTPPSVASGFHYNRNYDYPVSSPGNRPVRNVPMSTRPPTALEQGLIYFDDNYLAAFASCLEHGSGALPEEMVTNRDTLIAQGVQLNNEIHAKLCAAGGMFKHINRGSFARQLESLSKAIAILQGERDALFKEAHVVPFHSHRGLFNQKLPAINALISDLDQKLQNPDCALENVVDLNAYYAELRGISDVVKAKGEVLQLDPQTDPDLRATEDGLVAVRRKIDDLESSVKSYHELYAQKNVLLNQLLEDLNKRIQDGRYSDEDYEDLNDKHDELSALFQKIKKMGSFFGFNPKIHPDYIASERTLNEARAYIEKAHQLYESNQYGEVLEFEADTTYLAKELNNFNTIFAGAQAPDMEAFNNLMGAFMGKEPLSGGGAGSSSVLPESLSEGEYILTSFRYQDDKANVHMEIARMVEATKCAVPLPEDETTWHEGFFDRDLNLASISVVPQGSGVTLALFGNGDRVLLKSDLGSMTNYVAQRTMEGVVHLDPSVTNKAPVDIGKVPMYGLENADPSLARQVASIVMDFMPFVGTAKGVSELIFGYDHISGERIHRVVAGFGLVASVVPGAAGAGKLVGKAVVMGSEVITKNAGDVVKSLTRLKRNDPGRAIGGESLRYIKEGDTWLRGTHGNAGKIPKQIADKLRGRDFRSFDHFRMSFWKEVAKDPVLSKGFSSQDITNMKTSGIAPRVHPDQSNGLMNGYQLHHNNPFHNGGGLYDIDNINIVTPRFHKEVLPPEFHYNRK